MRGDERDDSALPRVWPRRRSATQALDNFADMDGSFGALRRIPPVRLVTRVARHQDSDLHDALRDVAMDGGTSDTPFRSSQKPSGISNKAIGIQMTLALLPRSRPVSWSGSPITRMIDARSPSQASG